MSQLMTHYEIQQLIQKYNVKRTPSSFLIYKTKHKLHPSAAKKAYDEEPKHVRLAYEKYAEIIRFFSSSTINAEGIHERNKEMILFDSMADFAEQGHESNVNDNMLAQTSLINRHVNMQPYNMLTTLKRFLWLLWIH
ncbi:17281_t:CDS:1 [Cetraspora pellucida]|uniref:17281_t:CDS:1 n=1 Tax=Cetraspora pellucida TaxID=1433469 RepID=A0A9N9GWP5_9GLOM|nr:17281_t:CDS:1 [Cetraspora pellucida]